MLVTNQQKHYKKTLMRDTQLKILDFIRKEKLIQKGERVLVGVSGGIDSVVLLYTLCDLAIMLEAPMPAVAHVNHMLRGKESDRDEEFVKGLAEDLRIQFVSERFDIKTLAENEKKTTQETARKYRLRFLEQAAEKLSCQKIATGHNEDDLAETTLMWITRGAGLKGASGILPKRGKFIRPLLCCDRKEISLLAEDKGIIHVEDSSNAKTDYIRNIFRHEIIPLIEEKCYSSAKKNMARFASLIKDDMEYLEYVAGQISEKAVYPLSQKFESVVEVQKLNELHPAIKKRLIRNMIREVSGNLENVTSQHIDSVIDLCSKADGGRRRINLPGELEAIKTYSKLMIRPILKDTKSLELKPGSEYPLNYPGSTAIETLELKVDTELLPGGRSVEKYHFDDPYIAFFNFDRISLPLKLRLPKQGDVFTPYGSKGSKKISDFFIDSKISADERWTIPLLTDSTGEIIWVCGYRTSELYRLDYTVKNVLMVKVSWL